MIRYNLILIIAILSAEICCAQVQKTLQLTGYNNNVTIQVQDKTALFISKGDTLKLALTTKNNLLSLSEQDDARANALLAFSDRNKQTVAQKYKDAYAGVSIAAQLINKAKDLGGSMIITKEVSTTTSTANDTTDSNVGAQNVEDDLPLQNLEVPAEQNLLKYLWLPFAVLSAIFGLLWWRGNKTQPTNADQTPPAIVQPLQNEANVQQIQQLQNKVQELSQQLQQAKIKDQKYFTNLLQQFLLPAKQALENGNHSSAAELTVAALYHTIAKANEYANNRSQSDVYNMDFITNGSSAAAKGITKDSNADAVQKELKHIIEYLQKNGATQLPNTIVLDHSLSNL